MVSDPKQTIIERPKTHGDFREVARIAQGTIDLWRSSKNWKSLSDSQREVLWMIAHKSARILSGDPNFTDHWHDICGYSMIIEKQILEAQK